MHVSRLYRVVYLRLGRLVHSTYIVKEIVFLPLGFQFWPKNGEKMQLEIWLICNMLLMHVEGMELNLKTRGDLLTLDIVTKQNLAGQLITSIYNQRFISPNCRG
jgi:hypothetical protein